MVFVNYIEIKSHTRMASLYMSLNSGQVVLFAKENSDCNNFFIFQQKRRVHV